MANFSARTIDQIFQELLTEKNTFVSLTGLTSSEVDLTTLLSALDSDSKVATWRLLQYVQSVGLWSHEQLMQIFFNDVEAEKETASVGNMLWYIEQCLKFQYGDILQINPDTYRPYYDVIDDNKKIIGSCAAQELGGNLLLKIRGLNTDLLNASQMDAFNSYLNKIKFAGVRLLVRNSPADTLKLYLKIYYDPQKPLADLKTEVEAAIETYITNIEFNSDLKTNTLIDRLQTISAVKDVRYNYGGGVTEGLWTKNVRDTTYTEFNWSTSSYSGYFSIDASFPLSATIEYITQL